LQKINRKDIIKEIISTRINIYNHKILYQKSGRRFWIIVLCFSISMTVLSFLSLLNIIKIDLTDIKNNELLFIGLWSIMVLVSYKMLKLKIKKPKIEKINTQVDEQLEKILVETKYQKEYYRESLASRLAEGYAMTIVFLAPLLISIIIKLADYNYDLIKLLKSYNENGDKNVIAYLFTIFFLVGYIAGSPISFRKYMKLQKEIKFKVNSAFIVNLYISKLNPEIEDETN